MIDWILNLIPATTMVVIGAAVAISAVFVGKIPVVGAQLLPYRWLALGVGVLLALTGAYLKGAENERKDWEIKVAQAEARVAVAEEKARTTSAQVETVYVDRVKEIVKNRDVIKERIVVVTERIDAQCKIDPVVVDILNDAALNRGAAK